MKEQRITRFHDNVDQWEVFRPFEEFRDAFLVGTGLLAREDVIDPPAYVRILDHLQTAVLPRAFVHGNKGTRELWRQDSVLIPVAVILVPGPGAAGPGILQDHL